MQNAVTEISDLWHKSLTSHFSSPKLAFIPQDISSQVERCEKCFLAMLRRKFLPVSRLGTANQSSWRRKKRKAGRPRVNTLNNVDGFAHSVSANINFFSRFSLRNDAKLKSENSRGMNNWWLHTQLVFQLLDWSTPSILSETFTKPLLSSQTIGELLSALTLTQTICDAHCKSSSRKCKDFILSMSVGKSFLSPEALAANIFTPLPHIAWFIHRVPTSLLYNCEFSEFLAKRNLFSASVLLIQSL